MASYHFVAWAIYELASYLVLYTITSYLASYLIKVSNFWLSSHLMKRKLAR